MEFPLFPLGTLQVPGAVLRLQIFEPRYLELLSDLSELSPEQREFGVVPIRQGHEVGPENLQSIAEAGCAVRILSAQPAGERMLVTAAGSWRFSIDRLLEDPDKPYLTAEVTRIRDREVSPEELVAPAERLRQAMQAYAAALGADDLELPEAPDELAWLIARDGPFPLSTGVELLADPDPVHRLRVLTKALQRETALVTHTHSVPFRMDRS
ncbi:LON peptidase substrate-binding domain-containing protein [Enemella evansiae]|uniref:LON peptidase substrate-binding domain-containing protein n=1 Tax=Enemella evansiae TaxID=2016499 RepID=UPI00105BDD57|nr:LON peptidase substrate-binding domain-containing protein [Enemella evansiae]TDO93364.1 hypothetical protein C8D81_1147 [Enemella evansiae]